MCAGDCRRALDRRYYARDATVSSPRLLSAGRRGASANLREAGVLIRSGIQPSDGGVSSQSVTPGAAAVVYGANVRIQWKRMG